MKPQNLINPTSAVFQESSVTYSDPTVTYSSPIDVYGGSDRGVHRSPQGLVETKTTQNSAPNSFISQNSGVS